MGEAETLVLSVGFNHPMPALMGDLGGIRLRCTDMDDVIDTNDSLPNGLHGVEIEVNRLCANLTPNLGLIVAMDCKRFDSDRLGARADDTPTKLHCNADCENAAIFERGHNLYIRECLTGFACWRHSPMIASFFTTPAPPHFSVSCSQLSKLRHPNE
ncbi:hypothetical protein [uncultured Tateyamaria sp.]|uniref:hypothetical protein n=1 Tax=uncultured Tateyamaria sp. TaxID=455651 RepID=UPI002627C72A|nr:hypothetical protein [uncultured Tateyamaria sp.]